MSAAIENADYFNDNCIIDGHKQGRNAGNEDGCQCDECLGLDDIGDLKIVGWFILRDGKIESGEFE